MPAKREANQCKVEHFAATLIERFYANVQIGPETIGAVSAMIHARFDEMMAEGAAELADLAFRRSQLGGEQ